LKLSEGLTFFIFASTLALTSAFPELADVFSILLNPSYLSIFI
jgi:hypothetical protein